MQYLAVPLRLKKELDPSLTVTMSWAITVVLDQAQVVLVALAKYKITKR